MKGGRGGDVGGMDEAMLEGTMFGPTAAEREALLEAEVELRVSYVLSLVCQRPNAGTPGQGGQGGGGGQSVNDSAASFVVEPRMDAGAGGGTSSSSSSSSSSSQTSVERVVVFCLRYVV